MKKYYKTNIFAAENTNGTIFWKTDLDQIQEALEDSNPFIRVALSLDGYKAIDFRYNLFGSYVDGDTLYICQTNYDPIMVNGEETNPETAMEDFGPEALSNYIQDASDDIVRRYITIYEVTNFDVDEVATELIQDGYSFRELIDYYNDLDIDEV